MKVKGFLEYFVTLFNDIEHNFTSTNLYYVDNISSICMANLAVYGPEGQDKDEMTHIFNMMLGLPVRRLILLTVS